MALKSLNFCEEIRFLLGRPGMGSATQHRRQWLRRGEAAGVRVGDDRSRERCGGEGRGGGGDGRGLMAAVVYPAAVVAAT